MFSNKGKIVVLTLACGGLSVLALPARAGFEWVPPGQQTPPASPVAKVEAQPLPTQPAPAAPLAAPVGATPAPVSAAPLPPPATPLLPDATASVTPAPKATPTYAPLAPVPASQPVLPPPIVAAPAAAPSAAQTKRAAAPAGKLLINPFPAEKSNVVSVSPTAPVPVPVTPAAPAVAGDYPLVVGFGSDLPLPLALNQVVPADYAYSFVSGANIGARVSWDGGKPWNVVLRDMLAPLGLEAVIAGKAVVIRPVGSQQLSQTATPAAAPAPQEKNEMDLSITDMTSDDVAAAIAVQPAAGDTLMGTDNAAPSAAEVIDDGLRRKNIVDPGVNAAGETMTLEQMRKLPAVTTASGL